MRNADELDSIIAACIKASGNTMKIGLVVDDEEELKWVQQRMRGKHGAKLVEVKIGDRTTLISKRHKASLHGTPSVTSDETSVEELPSTASTTQSKRKTRSSAKQST